MLDSTGIVNCLFCVYAALAVTVDAFDVSEVRKTIFPETVAASLDVNVYPTAGTPENCGLVKFLFSLVWETFKPNNFLTTSYKSISLTNWAVSLFTFWLLSEGLIKAAVFFSWALAETVNKNKIAKNFFTLHT